MRDEQIDEALQHIEALLSLRRRAFCAKPVTREVSLPQLHILLRLQEGGPTMVSELAHSLGISIPSASSIVDRMEEHGLVERTRNDIDRRVVHVAVSAHGRAVAEELHGPKQAQLQHLLERMTSEELEHVTQAIKAVLRVTEQKQSAANETDITAAS